MCGFTRLMHPNDADSMANSVNPDQTDLKTIPIASKLMIINMVIL